MDLDDYFPETELDALAFGTQEQHYNDSYYDEEDENDS
jgi:hypothetical protein